MTPAPYIIRRVVPILHWDRDYLVGTRHTPVDVAYTLGGAAVKRHTYDRELGDTGGHEAAPWYEIVDRNGRQVYFDLPHVRRQLEADKARYEAWLANLSGSQAVAF